MTHIELQRRVDPGTLALATVAIQFGVIGPFFHSEYGDGNSFDAWNTTVALSVLWFAVAVLLATFGPRLARWPGCPRGPVVPDRPVLADNSGNNPLAAKVESI